MTEEWRELLYSLGFLSSLVFGARFLLQWLDSERKKESVVTPLFWRLSLLGNALLLTHSFIQMQLPVFLIQLCNALISWRNLNLMERKIPLKAFLTRGFGFALFGLALYFSQFIWFAAEGPLFRLPASPWQDPSHPPLSLLWHLFGLGGMVLFNSRFWVQWWFAEKEGKSILGAAFWWISLIGDACCIVYFAKINDPVNLVGPALGLIPYVRNLMLISRARSSRQTT
jgi:lipid-A-disaccharide synthase-like uncharacterized protein